MIILKSASEISTMRAGGSILAEVLAEVADRVAPGVATLDLDVLAEAELRKRGAQPAFKGYRGYPASLCVSINSEVVHGIPRADRYIEKGDVVGLDLGCLYQGRYTDMAATVGAGRISRAARKLISVTREALGKGLKEVSPQSTVGDIGAAIQHYVEEKGFGVVRSLVGHGVGREIHEDPHVPNYGEHGLGPRLTEGMTIAIEPMVTAGDYAVEIEEDGWTVSTEDGSLAAHFEVTLAVTKNGYEILTTL